ncbi:hypothetical protein K1719_035193 [Acacia pycnantha]|nr:hypothetical protein K1719_035193 [Acacia pycnantha]
MDLQRNHSRLENNNGFQEQASPALDCKSSKRLRDIPQLLEDPLYYLQDIVTPGKMLFGRGTIFVHLNDMVFCVES